MRVGMVVAGIIVIVLGAVLLFVPLEPQANQTVDTSSNTPYYLAQISGFSITGSIPVSVSWTSNSTVEVIAAACTSQCINATQVSGATLQTGTSGSFTLDQPDGGYILMGALSSSGSGTPSVTFKITTALTTVGTILVVVGIILLIIGVVVRRKKSEAPTTPANAAATSPPMAQPSSGSPPSGGMAGPDSTPPGSSSG